MGSREVIGTRLLSRPLDRLLREHWLGLEGRVDFRQPAGVPALAGPDSISWQVFRNPLALYIGGITAVLLELAEPRVRTGVWEHTSFRTDPLRRLRRTGLAAMVTVYAAGPVAEDMIAGVARMHARVRGVTPAGVPYRADDPELLRWVHATALFGFMQAYHTYVRPLEAGERDRFVGEGAPAALRYGALDPPQSVAELEGLFDEMAPQLEASSILDEFLDIMAELSLFPAWLQPVNHALMAAAIGLLPADIRDRLGLSAGGPPVLPVRRAIRLAGGVMEHLHLESLPANQACERLGLPEDYLRPSRRACAAASRGEAAAWVGR